MGKRQWYYRGSLRSCNYTCSYCPFSKRRDSERNLQADREAWFRFVDTLCEKEKTVGAVQLVPYGEALIHSYYWEGLARLSHHSGIDAVGAQSNLSFPVEEMLHVFREQGGILDKLRLWGTFHPAMTTVDQFIRQCELLSGQGILYSVGAVGDPKQLPAIRQLRERLPDSVYLWINKQEGLGRNYSREEREAFLEIDEYFELELKHHRADCTQCGDNLFVEGDGSMRRCNLSRGRLGNLYTQGQDQQPAQKCHGISGGFQSDEKEGENTGKVCGRKECSCYLAYSSRKIEELLFFQPYPAFRIPFYPKAVFFDIDGTLLERGETCLSKETLQKLSRLMKHSEIYLATSLPLPDARRETKAIWDKLRGGVFAGGGRSIVWGRDDQGGRTVVFDEVEPLDESWLDRARSLEKKLGYSLYVYRKGRSVYKVTAWFSGKLPEDVLFLPIQKAGKRSVHLTEAFCQQDCLEQLAGEWELPDTCQVWCEEDCVQITRKGTGKWEGIQKICDQLGYRREEIAVFGNGERDIQMLQEVPFSVAAPGSSERVQESAAYCLQRDQEGRVIVL